MSTWTHTTPKEQLFSRHSALYDSFWQSIHGRLQQVHSQDSPLFLITKV
jgi:hypothetical protein